MNQYGCRGANTRVLSAVMALGCFNVLVKCHVSIQMVLSIIDIINLFYFQVNLIKIFPQINLVGNINQSLVKSIDRYIPSTYATWAGCCRFARLRCCNSPPRCVVLSVQTIEFDEGAGAVLRIQPLRAPRDENVYECVARNSEGEVSVTSKLSIMRGKVQRDAQAQPA